MGGSADDMGRDDRKRDYAARIFDTNMLRTLASRLSTQWHRAVAGLVPSQCAVCHAWPAQRVCGACIARFAQPQRRCPTCALPLPVDVPACGICLRAPPPLDQCLAALDYGYPWAQAIGQFKFQGDPGWAVTFAALIRSMPWAEPALEAADIVLPVPLSRERLQERGFNQALLLARCLAPHKTNATVLLRILPTMAQTRLTRMERLQNLRNALIVDPLQLAAVAGKRVVVIDDVMTTGATLHAAAQALRRAGAVHICGIVAARTMHRH